VWIAWQPWGDWIEGHSDVVALCTARQPVTPFEVEMTLVDGRLKAGVVFGYQDTHDFLLMQIWDDRKVHIHRRDGDAWRRIAMTAVPPAEDVHRLRVEQTPDNGVVLSVNGKEVRRVDASGRVGLTVDGCRVRFRVPKVAPARYRLLDELLLAAKRDAGMAATDAPTAAAEPADARPETRDSGRATTDDTASSSGPRTDPNRRDAQGRTPLHLSAFDGDLAAVKRLIAAGADLDATVADGSTPLMMAAFKGHRELAQALLSAGADVRCATPRGTTALHYAAARGDLELVRRFLGGGAEVDAKKPGGTTPLILAAQNGHAECVATLAEAGADVGAALKPRGVTGLMLAAQNGHTRTVAALLKAGADCTTKDRQGRTALDFASAKQRAPVVELLRKAMAEEKD
jgi:ankyrin repeat protein